MINPIKNKYVLFEVVLKSALYQNNINYKLPIPKLFSGYLKHVK